MEWNIPFTITLFFYQIYDENVPKCRVSLACGRHTGVGSFSYEGCILKWRTSESRTQQEGRTWTRKPVQVSRHYWLQPQKVIVKRSVFRQRGDVQSTSATFLHTTGVVLVADIHICARAYHMKYDLISSFTPAKAVKTSICSPTYCTSVGFGAQFCPWPLDWLRALWVGWKPSSVRFRRAVRPSRTAYCKHTSPKTRQTPCTALVHECNAALWSLKTQLGARVMTQKRAYNNKCEAWRNGNALPGNV